MPGNKRAADPSGRRVGNHNHQTSLDDHVDATLHAMHELPLVSGGALA